MSSTPYLHNVVVPGDDTLNDLYQMVMRGFSSPITSPITPDSMASTLPSDAEIEVSPPAQESDIRMFFFIHVDRSCPTHEII